MLKSLENTERFALIERGFYRFPPFCVSLFASLTSSGSLLLWLHNSQICERCGVVQQKGTIYFCYKNFVILIVISLGAKKIKGPINKGGGGAKTAEGNPAECQQQ